MSDLDIFAEAFIKSLTYSLNYSDESDESHAGVIAAVILAMEQAKRTVAENCSHMPPALSGKPPEPP